MLRALDCDQALGLDTTQHGGPSYSAWDVDKVAAGGMDSLDDPGGPVTPSPARTTIVNVKPASERASREHSNTPL